MNFEREPLTSVLSPYVRGEATEASNSFTTSFASPFKRERVG